MKWLRDEYLELVTFGNTERQMFVEMFGPLHGLEKEWEQQGATPDEISLTAFDWDYVHRANTGANFCQLSPRPIKVIKDDAYEKVYIDELGRTMRMIKEMATIPLPLDFPVKTMDDWLKIKPQYLFDESRIDFEKIDMAKKARDNEGALVVSGMEGGFDFPRQLMGEEEVCIAFLTDVELINDILNTIGDTAVEILKRITEIVTIDHLAVHEDMAGKSGPLVGPNIIESLIAPYYRRCWEVVEGTGGTTFMQDSDGDMTPVIASFLDAGLNAMHPFEPTGEQDIVAVRKKYGNSIFIKGGIDKHVLRRSKKEIVAELEYKMQPLMQAGGTIFGLDHRIPNGTSIENYRFYVNTGREILGLPALDGRDKGWQRMAG